MIGRISTRVRSTCMYIEVNLLAGAYTNEREEWTRHLQKSHSCHVVNRVRTAIINPYNADRSIYSPQGARKTQRSDPTCRKGAAGCAPVAASCPMCTLCNFVILSNYQGVVSPAPERGSGVLPSTHSALKCLIYTFHSCCFV